MSNPSLYPGFHKLVTKAYLVIICTLAVGLPLLHIFTKKPSIKQIIVIIVFAIVSYIAYWLIVRLNCYGTPLQERTNNNFNSINNDNNNNTTINLRPPRSNSSSSTHSSSNGGTNSHPTFASYRLGGLTEIFRRIGGSNVSSTTNDDEISCETGEILRPPPPTYNTALEGAGLPPPYMNDPIDINVHNSESLQMSERHVPSRRPVPSIPSSNSLRRLAPPIPQRRSSTQSIQDTSQGPLSDSSPRRLVPPIPQPPGRPSSLENTPQSPKRPVPPVPTNSSSILPPRFYRSLSHE